ncbi:mechanosensitive ion channel family protein [Brucella anthropi]|jgi:small conductance mechanosensitive channel|uniref:Small-conductance mechanosensitive channel n=2 Tax=Brucella anthropi TaxID=529 RepID=A0A6I0DYL9_BRUAN|nr:MULTISPECIES: mechanosensitive ion channel domain-containing protein [Brucella/Ochrobactrum group]QTN02754.1 mechanosensitive ion channel [Ochrobactrum sp. EEELCW01]KAB2738174.1 mechanosensitive ion channel [Brucella anthropi]KAB2760621.1 mechanosensitive ion channel [Brucella anthropi]KAB2771831.1 mechanosensitive ion channel [Brucella anthropi]KAB2803487.1 mechanosensitive ion channel [Brucella anthropi]
MEEQATQLIANTNAFVLQMYDLLIRYSVSTLGALIILCVGWILAGILQKWTIQSLSKIRGFDQTLVGFFGAVVRYSILVIILVMVLGQFGVQTASILAALGAIGLAIGLALQGTLQNIAAGIMILVLRPFRVGEYISAGTVVGTVQDVGLFATELKTIDGLYVLAPNSSLWNTPVTNYSRMKTRMHEFKVGIGYEDNIDQAFAIIKKVVEDQKGVLSTPAPAYFVSQLGDSAVVLSANYWINSADYAQVSRHTIKTVKIEFDKAGINIPYPQMTYHVIEKDNKTETVN